MKISNSAWLWQNYWLLPSHILSLSVLPLQKLHNNFLYCSKTIKASFYICCWFHNLFTFSLLLSIQNNIFNLFTSFECHRSYLTLCCHHLLPDILNNISSIHIPSCFPYNPLLSFLYNPCFTVVWQNFSWDDATHIYIPQRGNPPQLKAQILPKPKLVNQRVS